MRWRTLSWPRRVSRVCAYVVGAHISIAAALLASARVCNDSFLDAHWHYSTPVVAVAPPRATAWWPWRRLPALTAEERRCVQALLDCLALRQSPRDTAQLSPRVVWHDTLLLYDGAEEVGDGAAVVRRCVHGITPVVVALRREHDDAMAATFVHCKLDVRVTWRVPLLHHLLGSNHDESGEDAQQQQQQQQQTTTRPCYCVHAHVPMTVTLQLERAHADGADDARALVITGVEQRWFGGLLCSRQAGALSSPLGDCGDLHRRLGAFVLTRCSAHAQRIAAAAANTSSVQHEV